MSDPVQVFLNEDPYLTIVVYQAVTKSGQFYTMSQAQVDIGTGKVFVNGKEMNKRHAILSPGLYTIEVGPNSYQVQVNHSAKE